MERQRGKARPVHTGSRAHDICDRPPAQEGAKRVKSQENLQNRDFLLFLLQIIRQP